MQIQNTYEYRVYIDPETRKDTWNQIILARQMYNDIVAKMREIHQAMQDYTFNMAGGDATEILSRIELLTEKFAAAKSANDESELKQIADERRAAWRELSPILKAVRKEHKQEIQERFLSKVGNGSASDTYPIRAHYIEKGLGWATATDVLDRALVAWKKRFPLGKPPEFAKGSEKTQDTLVLQFTAAGGLPFSAFQGKNKELVVEDGEFQFRLGSAKSNTYATGRIVFHRDLPENCTIPKARLVCKRVANKEEYYLQFVVSSDLQTVTMNGKKPLLAVHFGWNADVSGRRVCGINDTPDPSTAQIIQLPTSIEEDLQRAAEVQALRDTARDELHPKLKGLPLTGDEQLDADIIKIQRLPAQHIEQARVHRIMERWMHVTGLDLPDDLRQWKSLDKKRWQAEVGIAKRARARRKEFYTLLAREWCRQYSAIVIEPLDLKEAAIKLNEQTGEKTEFSKKARAGRVVASLYELESAIHWQAKKAGVAVFEENPETVSVCAHCGSTHIKPRDDDWQVLECADCGAQTDRKDNGASILYQSTVHGIESRTAEYHQAFIESENKRLIAKAEKLRKMQEGRRAKREAQAMPESA